MHILQQLVQIESVSGKEESIQKFIVGYTKSLELVPLVIEGNVVLKIAGVNSKRALIFNAHVDTVPAGDVSLWEDDPFAGRVKGDLVFGLGASDDKSGVATLLELIEYYSKTRPLMDLWFFFVKSEEVDGSGTKASCTWFLKNELNEYKNVSAIITEPTDGERINIGHKGNYFVSIKAMGDTGHGSEPEKIKKHAIVEVYKAVAIVEALALTWKKKYKDELLGFPTVGLTAIAGGDIHSPNKFPDSAIAVFDIRTTPLMHANVLTELKSALGDGFEVTTLYEPGPVGHTDPKEAIVEVTKAVSGGKVGVSTGSNDMCFFSEIGIPCVVFGFGAESGIHKPNESCSITEIGIGVGIFKQIIEEMAKKD